MKIIDIIKKDMRLVLSDPKALVFTILMPIVLILILSFSLSSVFDDEGISFDVIQVGIVDNNTPFERALLSALQASPYDLLANEDIANIINFEMIEDISLAESKQDAGKIDVIVIVPDGFYNAVVSNLISAEQATHIEVRGSLNSAFKANIVSSIITAYTEQLSATIADNKLLGEYLASNDFSSYIGKLEKELEQYPLTISEQGIGQRQPVNQFYYYSIAITCMFILYTAGQGSSFLLEESRHKTLARLTAANVSRNKLLVGKSLAIFALCVVQFVVLMCFSTLAFSLNWGNLLVFVFISVALSFAICGIGTLLMVLAYKTDSQNFGNIFVAVGAQLLALIGGSFIPLTLLPKFFSTAALFTPNGLGILAFTSNVQGAPFSEVLPYIVGNIAIGLVSLSIGVIWFRKKGRREA